MTVILSNIAYVVLEKIKRRVAMKEARLSRQKRVSRKDKSNRKRQKQGQLAKI